MTLAQVLHDNPTYLMFFLIVANPILGLSLGFISVSVTRMLGSTSAAQAAIAGFAVGSFYTLYTWSLCDLDLLVVAARLCGATVISSLFAYHHSLNLNNKKS